ncbi:MAG: hypothetical protein AABX11_00530 [Nanoarchaeota archaeon]
MLIEKYYGARLSTSAIHSELKQGGFLHWLALKKSSEKNKAPRIEVLDKWIENQFKKEIKENKEKFALNKINKIVINTIKQ